MRRLSVAKHDGFLGNLKVKIWQLDAGRQVV